MKAKYITGAIAVLWMAPAMAADLPVKAARAPIMASPIYDWTGLYVGLNAGGGQSRDCWTTNGALVFNFTPPVAEGCNGGTGAIAGGQIGYRHQWNNFVFGFEGQGDWANLSGSNTSTLFSGLGVPAAIQSHLSLTNTSKVDALGTFTGQVGYSFGPLLWYVKGGAAFTDNKYDGSLSISGVREGAATPIVFTDHANQIKFGEVVGTGLDWMFAPGWSIGVEYSHLFMGSQNVGLAFTNPPITTLGTGVGLLGPGAPSRNTSISQDIDMATFRINYTFSAGR